MLYNPVHTPHYYLHITVLPCVQPMMDASQPLHPFLHNSLSFSQPSSWIFFYIWINLRLSYWVFWVFFTLHLLFVEIILNSNPIFLMYFHIKVPSKLGIYRLNNQEVIKYFLISLSVPPTSYKWATEETWKTKGRYYFAIGYYFWAMFSLRKIKSSVMAPLNKGSVMPQSTEQ